MQGLIEDCEREALALLRENLGAGGIMAAGRGAAASRRGYDLVFARDAAVCALAMALSGDAQLERGAAQGLATLAERQAGNGQIPKFVDRGSGSGDFWYVGCIDQPSSEPENVPGQAIAVKVDFSTLAT